MAYETGFRTTLAVEMTTTDTSMVVATAPTITAGRVFLDNGAIQERMNFTGRTGTTLTGLTRNLSKTADPSTGGVGYEWMAGTTIRIVAMHDQMLDKQNPQTIGSLRAYSGANAGMNLSGAKKGFSVPNLTTAERLALTAVSGMVVYDTDQGKLYQYANGTRGLVGSGGGSSGAGRSKTAKSDNTVYQAGPNGGVLVATRTYGASATDLYIYSDGSNPPTTVVGMVKNGYGYDNGTVTVPILPNMYYKAVGGDYICNYYEIGSGSGGNTIFISQAQSVTAPTVFTITHNLNITEAHVEQGRYQVMFGFTYGGNGMFKVGIYNGQPNDPQYIWSSSDPVSGQITFQANTMKVIPQATATDVRVHIIDTWITSGTLPYTGNNVYVSSNVANVSNGTVSTFTHNLNVTQADVQNGRYKVILTRSHASSIGVGRQDGNSNLPTTDGGQRHERTASNPVQTYNVSRQANTVKTINSGNDITNLRCIIQDLRKI